MPKNRIKKTPKSLDDLIEFFDTNDLGEYWDQLPEAHFDVNIQKRIHLIAIDTAVANRVAAIARSKRTSSSKLINSWLKEKIREEA